MHAFVVWMDSGEARFFELAPDGFHLDSMRQKARYTRCDEDKEARHFYHEVAEYLMRHAGQVLVLGPGNTKDRFYGYVQNHFASDLAQKVVGVQWAEEPSDREIIRAATKYFTIARQSS